jgi:hypothetical protein
MTASRIRDLEFIGLCQGAGSWSALLSRGEGYDAHPSFQLPSHLVRKTASRSRHWRTIDELAKVSAGSLL